MLIDITGNGLKLLEHFIYYGSQEPYSISVADALLYDHDGFKQRLADLKRAFEEAAKSS